MKFSLKNGYELFATQLEDLKTICGRARFANFSEMGAGKSLPNALLSKGVIDDGICKYAIIVTPKIVLSDWYDIFKDQMDCDYKSLVTVYHAPRKVLPFIKLKPIVILTYETLAYDIQRFLALARANKIMITFDEAHKLRNHDSTLSIKCTELSFLCSRVYLLTGSPLTNGLKNAYAYINILAPNEYYRSYNIFKIQHLRYSKFQKRKLVGYANVAKVAAILESFSVRHLKREVVELPPISFKTRAIDWDPKQRVYYKQFVEEQIIELENNFIDANGAGAILTRCHQIITNPQQLGLPCDSTRFKYILEDLEAIGLEDHKVVIFAHYRHTVKRLKELLAEYNPAVIYGATTNVDAEKDKFKTDDSCRLMIANAISAGIGTNFSIASHVFFFEYSYDLDSYDQAVARLDRPGQQNPITVVNYAVKGSMELTKILPALINKKALSMQVLNDPVALIKFISLDDTVEDELGLEEDEEKEFEPVF